MIKCGYGKLLPAVFILFNVFFTPFVKADEGPIRPEELEKAVWKYNYKDNGGTGFFIGKNLVITSFHVLVNNGAFLDALLKDEKAVQNIKLSQKGTSEVLKIKRILHISAAHDLALLEIEGEVSNYLSLGESPLKPDEELFMPAYPVGVFRQIRSTGYDVYETVDGYFYLFAVNHSYLPGASGGPVLSKEGEVVGVTYQALANMLLTIKIDHLQSFVRRHIGLSCLDFPSAAYCIKAEMENLKKQAEQGLAPAQYGLATRHRDGIGTEQNFEQALHWYTKAAERGFAIAQSRLARMYYEGKGMEKNFEQAFYWFKEAAEQGLAPAQSKLAAMYYFGEGTEQNFEQHFYWLKSAAKQGLVLAQYVLSVAYIQGEGTERNFEQAFYWLKNAAKQGLAPAQYKLAKMYRDGIGTEQNFEQTLYWLKNAARQGFAPAQNALLFLFAQN